MPTWSSGLQRKVGLLDEVELSSVVILMLRSDPMTTAIFFSLYSWTWNIGQGLRLAVEILLTIVLR